MNPVVLGSAGFALMASAKVQLRRVWSVFMEQALVRWGVVGSGVVWLVSFAYVRYAPVR